MMIRCWPLGMLPEAVTDFKASREQTSPASQLSSFSRAATSLLLGPGGVLDGGVVASGRGDIRQLQGTYGGGGCSGGSC